MKRPLFSPEQVENLKLAEQACRDAESHLATLSAFGIELNDRKVANMERLASIERSRAIANAHDNGIDQ